MQRRSQDFTWMHVDAVDVVSVQFFAAGDHQAGCPFEMPRLPAAILLARGSCFDQIGALKYPLVI